MIIIGISGSIAAYKAIDLAKLLVENDFEIAIILSESAQDFVSVLTLKSLFPGRIYLSDDALGQADEMLHISLARSAEMIVIAPASANMISKIKNGAANCLLTTICLASKAPIIVAPAMNRVMWENEFVQENIAKLKHVIGPASGKQACGDEGLGRMVEPKDIVEYIKNFTAKKILKKEQIVITAGPTIEKIDPIRFISNFSSGKMGYAVAKMAVIMGADVTLISGPTNLAPVHGVKLIAVESSQEMYQASLKEAENCDIFIGTAAVADYSPEEYKTDKIKKSSADLVIKLKQTQDIIASVRKAFNNIFIVGFAAETNNLYEYGYKKLQEKQLDIVAINDVSEGKVFGQNHNALNVITKDGNNYTINTAPKEQVAKELLEIIASLRNKTKAEPRSSV